MCGCAFRIHPSQPQLFPFLSRQDSSSFASCTKPASSNRCKASSFVTKVSPLLFYRLTTLRRLRSTNQRVAKYTATANPFMHQRSARKRSWSSSHMLRAYTRPIARPDTTLTALVPRYASSTYAIQSGNASKRTHGGISTGSNHASGRPATNPTKAPPQRAQTKNWQPPNGIERQRYRSACPW